MYIPDATDNVPLQLVVKWKKPGNRDEPDEELTKAEFIEIPPTATKGWSLAKEPDLEVLLDGAEVVGIVMRIYTLG